MPQSPALSRLYRSASGPMAVLLATLALPLSPAPASAETLTVAARSEAPSESDRPASSPSIEVRRAEKAASPQECAADYHARLRIIADNELAALKAVEPSVGTANARLPGRFHFELGQVTNRPNDGPMKTAVALAALRGQATVPTGANARWIAGRIEMDLTDYLTQGPSPFLCSGVANYLETLRRFAGQIGPSSVGRADDIELQKATATASLHAARQALFPTAVPHPAFRQRGDEPIASRDLLLTAEMRPADAVIGPVRLAERRMSETLADISDAQPRLGQPLPLTSDADRLSAIDRLLDDARRAGLLAAETTDANTAARRSVEAAGPDGRPVLVRLAQVRRLLDQQASRFGAHPARAPLEIAFADIEALDYLVADADGASDPVGTALAATMNAIEDAHAEACRCTP